MWSRSQSEKRTFLKGVEPGPLGPVEIPGTVAECRGRFRMVYWKSTGKSYGRFPAVVRPLFSQNNALFDYRLFLRWGAPAELAFIWF